MWLLCFFLAFLAAITRGQAPCQARQIPGQSVVCVCDTSHCDSLVRVAPRGSTFYTYHSSEAGSRFSQDESELETAYDIHTDDFPIILDTNTRYQRVMGFGGAVTDAAAINWANLTDPDLKQKLIESYFGASGLQYNMIRVPIGGSDFSTHPYAYNELPRDDLTLSNFSLTSEDYDYKIPMIKAITSAAADKIQILASTWSPPLWMKTNETYGGVNQLKPECYQAYADYHLRFIEEYAAQGIDIWGITTTNEPINGVIGFVEFNSLGWSPIHQGEWIADHLGPTIRNSSFSDLKILACDDQRASIPWYFNMMVTTNPDALQYIDGVAVHFYTDTNIPADILSLIYDNYPDKFILATEASEGAWSWQKEKVLLGSWERAEEYIIDVMDDLNHNVVGWIDWNLCLNAQGGPNWVENYVDSPVIVFPEKGEFVKQPMFYALGHFSKFLPRGSQRIRVTQASAVANVAFVTPNNTVVVVLYNDGCPKNVSIHLGSKRAPVAMEARSVVTVELPLD